MDGKLAEALGMMKDAGFNLNANIQLAVDERLPFMGYTSNSWDKHVIVVSGFALESPMLNGLLLHELSHIYRQVTNHPSHNPQIIANAAKALLEQHNLSRNYQREILHQVINHLQDLYADDISMKVIRRNERNLFPLDTMFRFFYDWIKDRPITAASGEEAGWRNAALILNNSFAISNMKRHDIPDIQNQAQQKNSVLLAQLGPDVTRSFSYFNHLMVTMHEKISEAEYANLIGEYLTEFIRLTDLF